MPSSDHTYSPDDLDRAATGREIGTLVAMVLIRSHGDPDAALATLAELDGIASPQEPGELDAPPIAAQAIRDVGRPRRHAAMTQRTENTGLCILGHRQTSLECPACAEALGIGQRPVEHWRWFRTRTSSKRIKGLIDEHLRDSGGSDGK